MTKSQRSINTSSMREIDFILRSPGIGCCRWPLSSWLDRDRGAGDQHALGPPPAGRNWLRRRIFRTTVCTERPIPEGSITAPKPD